MNIPRYVTEVSSVTAMHISHVGGHIGKRQGSVSQFIRQLVPSPDNIGALAVKMYVVVKEF